MISWYPMNGKPLLRHFLLIVLVLGCSKPGANERRTRDFTEEIRRNSALIRLDSNIVAAHRALGDAYLEQVSIQLRTSRSRKEEYPYSTIPHPSTPAGFEKAIFHLSIACRLDSLNDTIWTERARAYFLRYTLGWRSGYDPADFRKASELLQKALSLNPHSSQANYMLGVLQSARYSLYNPDRAISFLQRAIESKPDFADALFALGEIYDRQQSHVLAHSFARRALSAGLSDPEAYLHLGDSDPNWNLMAHYRGAIRRVPLIARGVFNLGMQIFLRPDGDWRNEMYSMAFELDPTSPQIVSNYGYACWRRGDASKAIECYMKSDLRQWGYDRRFYKRVITVHPEFVSAYVDLASTLYGPFVDSSIALLKKAIALDPTRGDAYILLFNEYREKGTPDSALSYLEKYIGASKADTAYDVYYRLGWLYVRGRNFEKFKNLFVSSQAARTFVLDGPVFFDWDYHRRLDVKSIRRAYESVIGSDARSNALVYSALANLAAHENDSTTELMYREKAARTDPSDINLAEVLAKRCHEMGRLVQALNIYKVLCDSLPENTYLLYSTAEILIGLGRKVEGEKYIDRIRALDPLAGEESYYYAQGFPIESQYGMKAYIKAARLCHKAAQDTLKSRNISW